MRKLGLLALVAIIGGAWYIVHDVGRIPLFDAALHRLAETQAEGYCAGTTFWANRGSPNPQQAAECRAVSTLDGSVDLTVVQPLFCKGVIDSGYAGSQSECEAILTAQKLWPTYDGGLTANWSKSAPYPGDLVFMVPGEESRTGERDGFSRDDPTTTTTSTTTGED